MQGVHKLILNGFNAEERLEARAGIEPAHKGFADLSLTTWVPRLGRLLGKPMRSLKSS